MFILILTTVFVVFFYTVALIRLCGVETFRKNATIFTVSLAAIYIVYMCWTSLASHPDAQCNPFANSGGNTGAQIIVGLFFTFITLLSISISSTEHSGRGESETHSVGGSVM